MSNFIDILSALFCILLMAVLAGVVVVIWLAFLREPKEDRLFTECVGIICSTVMAMPAVGVIVWGALKVIGGAA